MNSLNNNEFNSILDSIVKNSKDPLLANLFREFLINTQNNSEFELDEKQFQEFISFYLDNTSDEFLKDIIPEEIRNLSQFRSDQDHLKLKIREIWGEALDLLEILYLMSYEIGSNFNQEEQRNPENSQDFIFIALTRLHGRACQTFFEIIILLENGFASGANARWRTLDEIAVTAFFIQKHGQEIAERYLNHSYIDSLTAMIQHNEHADRLDVEKCSEDEINKIRDFCSELKMKYGPEFSNNYGWASPVLLTKKGKPNFKPNYSMLEKDVNLNHLKPYYKMASHAVHAHSKGILFNLSYHPEEKLIPSGSSIFGLADPGQLAAISLIQTNTVLLISKPTVTRMVYLKAMQKLLKDIKTAFSNSHLILEQFKN